MRMPLTSENGGGSQVRRTNETDESNSMTSPLTLRGGAFGAGEKNAWRHYLGMVEIN